MYTLSGIRTLARQRADMEGSQFIKDSELTNYVNASYAELYDLLVSRFEDYFSKTFSFTLAGISTQTLPADFYKVRGLDFQDSSPSGWSTIRRFNFAERNALSRSRDSLIFGTRPKSYRVMGQNLNLLPENQTDGVYRLWYIPRYTPLVNDTDTLGDILDFEEYIVVDAAIKCLLKEESDVSALMAVKQSLKDRIKEMSSTRDAGGPEKVADVSGAECFEDYFLPRG